MGSGRALGANGSATRDLPVVANPVQTSDRRNTGGGHGIGDEQVRSCVAVVVMPAGEMVAGRAFVIRRRIVVMVRMFGWAIVHRVDREIGQLTMLVRDHEYRAVLDLIGGFGGCSRRIEQHQSDTQRADQTIKAGRNVSEHEAAFNLRHFGWQAERPPIVPQGRKRMPFL